MAMFKADPQGFLVGELIDTRRDLLAVQQQSLTVWRGVRTDVTAIARAMGVSGRTSASRVAVRASASVAPLAPYGGSGAIAMPVGRGGGARQAATSQAAAVHRSGRATAIVQPRDAAGRFATATRDGDSPAVGGPALKDAAGRLTRAAGSLAQAAGGMEQVDATVAVSKEVAEVVAPLGRGLFGLFGRNTERRRERWYQRIWKALTSPVVGKRDAQPAAGGPGMLQTMMGGMFGGVGGLLSKVPSMLMTVFSRLLLPVAALQAATADWDSSSFIAPAAN